MAIIQLLFFKPNSRNCQCTLFSAHESWVAALMLFIHQIWFLVVQALSLLNKGWGKTPDVGAWFMHITQIIASRYVWACSFSSRDLEKLGLAIGSRKQAGAGWAKKRFPCRMCVCDKNEALALSHTAAPALYFTRYTLKTGGPLGAEENNVIHRTLAAACKDNFMVGEDNLFATQFAVGLFYPRERH